LGVLAWAGVMAVDSGASPEADGQVRQRRQCAFVIHWPTRDPTSAAARSTRPLLRGELTAATMAAREGGQVLRLRITLTRPDDDAARRFWNRSLAFPQHAWMKKVRVWDKTRRWLWPNLPYLLRLPGIERLERYGGVDPGKGVDNDFAAVLIRRYSGLDAGAVARADRAPLVSAEWHPVGHSGDTQLDSLVHTARSDAFSLQLGAPTPASSGRAAVWLIYADFFGANPPANWPREAEFAGGILAYFEVVWRRDASQSWSLDVRQSVPPRGTGFDWSRWSAEGRARLTDTQAPP
jgi:hypothetical protein